MITSIALDATHFAAPQPTGVEEYVHFLLPLLTERLLTANVSVSWISHEEQRAAEAPPGVEWVFSPHKPQWSQTALPALLKKIHPDLYFTPSGIPPLIYKGKTASTVHDLGVYLFPDSYTLEQRFLLKYVAKKAAQKAVVTLTPSAYSKKILQSYWGISGEKIIVTPLAYEKESVTPEPLSYVAKDPFLAYIGRIESKKNLVPVIEGFAKMNGQVVTELVLAGKDGYGAREIHRAIAKLPAHIRSRIVTPGYISRGQKQWLFENASAMIIPGRAEGFGIPILEAFAFGVPILCAQAGSLPEVAADAAVYVQADIPTDWSLQMASVLTDKHLAEQLVLRGRLRLKKFNWDTTAELSAEALLNA